MTKLEKKIKRKNIQTIVNPYKNLEDRSLTLAYNIMWELKEFTAAQVLIEASSWGRTLSVTWLQKVLQELFEEGIIGKKGDEKTWFVNQLI